MPKKGCISLLSFSYSYLINMSEHETPGKIKGNKLSFVKSNPSLRFYFYFLNYNFATFILKGYHSTNAIEFLL